MNEKAGVDPLRNADATVVDGFGDEWSRFDQAGVPPEEMRQRFDEYFALFPWSDLPAAAEGFDAGCGSGRWAAMVASRVGLLNAVDASAEALAVARRNLAGVANVRFFCASVADLPIADDSQDFGYSLGVLHHVPDTGAGLAACVRKLKPGAPFLVYLYYRFDNRPVWFQAIWRVSDSLRRVISHLPHKARYGVSQIFAALAYWPLARTARLAERLGVSPDLIPLSFYRDKSFYTMRTDALDRFGTRLEQRFTRREIEKLMNDAGLQDVRFSETAPFWCAVGYRVR